MAAELLRKLTIKTCGNWTKGKINALIVEKKLKDGEQVSIIKIVGVAGGAKTGQTDLGQYTKLAGEFTGIDLHTGAIYNAGQCILPEFVGSQVSAMLINGEAVKFAFEIAVRRKDSAATGYEYVVVPLMEAKPSNQMNELLALAGIDPSKAPALPAPTDKTKPTPAAKK